MSLPQNVNNDLCETLERIARALDPQAEFCPNFLSLRQEALDAVKRSRRLTVPSYKIRFRWFPYLRAISRDCTPTHTLLPNMSHLLTNSLLGVALCRWVDVEVVISWELQPNVPLFKFVPHSSLITVINMSNSEIGEVCTDGLRFYAPEFIDWLEDRKNSSGAVMASVSIKVLGTGD